MTLNAQQLAEDAARCEAAGVHFNPPDLPPALRPPSQQSGWERPFIRTVTVEDVPYPGARKAAERNAEEEQSTTKARLAAMRLWWIDLQRSKWVEAWPAGICYEVVCPHRVWFSLERLGAFPTLDEALAFVADLPARPLTRDDD
jgi:hypothetical protein